MIVAMHQPHFFPWFGYFNKIALADCFVLLDEVQLEKGSYMYRNRILNINGDITYLTVSADKHGFIGKQFKNIEIKDQSWRKKHLDMLKNSYGRSRYFDEVMDVIMPLYSLDMHTVCEYDILSIQILLSVLEINTRIILQSEINHLGTPRKNDLVVNICKALDADIYLSGNGAKKYMNEDLFKINNISVEYQKLHLPQYSQMSFATFTEGLSMLDMLFNVGLEETKKIFWECIWED